MLLPVQVFLVGLHGVQEDRSLSSIRVAAFSPCLPRHQERFVHLLQYLSRVGLRSQVESSRTGILVVVKRQGRVRNRRTELESA